MALTGANSSRSFNVQVSIAGLGAEMVRLIKSYADATSRCAGTKREDSVEHW